MPKVYVAVGMWGGGSTSRRGRAHQRGGDVGTAWTRDMVLMRGTVLHCSNSGWIWVIIGTQLDTIWGESGLE